ncbi:MAG: response regulator [Methylophilus sp.]
MEYFINSNMDVLLIEDSLRLQRSIVEMLSDYTNIHIDDIARTKDEATALLDKKQYDLIIVDIELAQGNGLDVIKHTQQSHYAFTPPVVLVLTNHANNFYRKIANSLNVKYFYDKSMDFESAMQSIVDESALLN